MIDCFHKLSKLDLIYFTQCTISTVTSSFKSWTYIYLNVKSFDKVAKNCCNKFSKSVFWVGVLIQMDYFFCSTTHLEKMSLFVLYQKQKIMLIHFKSKFLSMSSENLQKQSPGGALYKRCS